MVQQYILPIIVIFLLIYLVWREKQHDNERKDLYNRIMASNLADYTASGRNHPLPQSRSFLQKRHEEFLKRSEHDDN